MNMAGSIDSNFIRTKLLFPDDGVYVGEIISHYLLDTSMVLRDDYDICNEEQLTSTVDVIERFKDKNRPGTSVLSYWEQQFNETSGLWHANPGSAASLFPFANRVLDYVNSILDLTQLKLSPNHQAMLNLT